LYIINKSRGDKILLTQVEPKLNYAIKQHITTTEKTGEKCYIYGERERQREQKNEKKKGRPMIKEQS
jgi:hypothetical protein